MLDEIVAADHSIRTVEALLNACDWASWEARYDGHMGQPTIHPRLMAESILYGLMRNLRSSRQLEDATKERQDFRWFLEGREIDHSTFCLFRTAHEKALKGLNRQIAKAVCAADNLKKRIRLMAGPKKLFRGPPGNPRTARSGAITGWGGVYRFPACDIITGAGAPHNVL